MTVKNSVAFKAFKSALPALVFLIGITIIPGFAYGEMENSDCLGCHSDKTLEAETDRGKKLTLFVPQDALKGSVHEDLSCTDCHTGAKSFEDIPHSDKPLQINCGQCHDEVEQLLTTTDVHGRAYKNNNPRAPYCSHCHGSHNILPLSSPESILSRKNQVNTCGKCHGSEEINQEDGITKRNLITRYTSSVHWQVIQEGKAGASCTNCHGHHTILSSASDKSTVSRNSVANTCTKCHPNEVKTFWNGAHGKALANGNNDVPICITCHGDHDMASLRTRIGDAKQWASTQVCTWCHGNKRMMARYGLDTTPVDSYMSDFHGLTQRGTMGASATCADCHEPHHSLPVSHPGSRMHISNRGTACGKCHGKVSQQFALSFSHQKAMKHQGAHVENIIEIVYILLIVGSVGGMLLHNFLIWLYAVRKKIKYQRHEPSSVLRMTPYERYSHMILFLTFTMLVITGFALRFPESFWARFLFSIGMTEVVRGFIHRLSAMVMTLDIILFVAYMFFHTRGKRVLKQLLPAKRDFSDVFQTFLYYIGKREKPVKYSVFNYAEKFEFWALVWGTVVMFVTGIVLWFPKVFTAGLSSWVIGVARVIHFYEAVLAGLAILVFHFFYVLFKPGEYPMNTSWLTGNIGIEEAREHFDDEAIESMSKYPLIKKKVKTEKEKDTKLPEDAKE